MKFVNVILINAKTGAWEAVGIEEVSTGAIADFGVGAGSLASRDSHCDELNTERLPPMALTWDVSGKYITRSY